jgi:ABC-2 type transport system ATP-binding protein
MHAIEIENINKYYGSQKVLDDVSFTVDSGEITGLLGPNGAGKSTLMKILTSYIPPYRGQAKILGLDVQHHALETRKKIGYLPENNPLYPEMYVREYLTFVLRMYSTGFSEKKRTDEVIELTGLGPEQHKKIGMLSKGYRQRVGLAQALIHDPPVLILDEPTTGLDPNQLTDIRSVITSLARDKAVLLSTHILQEVEAICDNVIIINKGRVVADGKTETVLQKSASLRGYSLEFKERVTPEVFTGLKGITYAEKRSETRWLLHSESNEDLREHIFRFVVDKNLTLLSFSMTSENLEDVFRQLTEN